MRILLIIAGVLLACGGHELLGVICVLVGLLAGRRIR